MLPIVTITGANGFVGRALCAEAVVRGVSVRGITRVYCDLPSGVENLLVGDIDASTVWQEALINCRIVIHLAARVHVLREYAADPLAEFRRVNVEGTLNLARQAVAAGVQRFVFISSIGVNGVRTANGRSFSENEKPNPHNAYAVSKWEAVQALMLLSKETGLEVVILRPPLVYGRGAPGNFSTLIRAVQRGWPLPLGAVQNQRSFIAVDNLVDFIFTCSAHPEAANHTFLVSDGNDMSTTQLLLGLARVAGVPTTLIPVPVWVLRVAATVLGKGDSVRRLCDNLQIDISKARCILGWTPPVLIDEGLRRAVVGRGDS